MLNKARTLHAARDLPEAERTCREALIAAPRDPEWMHLLGLCVLDQGRALEALGWLQEATSRTPAGHPFNVDLAAALGRLGRHREAAERCMAAVQVDPANVGALHNLGVAHESLREFGPAADAYRAALAIRPDWETVRTRLAGVLRRSGRLAEAEAAYRQSIQAQPYQPAAWSGLATTLEETARPAEAVECHRRVLALMPNSPVAHDNLLTALHYPDDVGPDQIYQEHLKWAGHHARPGYPLRPRTFTNDPTVARPLRVGYVSPDFSDHAAAHFFEPLLAHHDRGAVEVFCYSDVRPQHRDAVTTRCQSYGHAWRDIAGLSDEGVERIIREDRIDVLVDLAGHMANPRLTLFARRPAPVQVTYVGYPSTTGLATMGYRLTDSLIDQPGRTERWHTERLVRLDPCCLCYRPDDDAPDIGPLPALARGGRVTFAAFNRLAKVSHRTLMLWGRVLHAVPDSRLLVKVADGAEADPAILGQFARHGIGGDRLALVGRKPSGEYLRLWHEADVALDSFPYHGVTTTCEGLWMGVPTVSLAGNTHVSRVGVSLLGALKLNDFIAGDDAGYVAAAVDAVGNLTRLAGLRTGLRARMQRSPLCDAVGLARRVEAAYEMMVRELFGNRI